MLHFIHYFGFSAQMVKSQHLNWQHNSRIGLSYWCFCYWLFLCAPGSAYRHPAKEDPETPWPAVLGKSLFLCTFSLQPVLFYSHTHTYTHTHIRSHTQNHEHCSCCSAPAILWQTPVKTFCSVKPWMNWHSGNLGPNKHHHCEDSTLK